MASSFAARAGAWLIVLCALALLFCLPNRADAFCGFYVGKASITTLRQTSA